MNLQVPKDKAIKILRQRITELSDLSFNSKAWKNKTENDLREIFPLGSAQWLQVSSIQFDTVVTSEKARIVKEGKDTASKLLSSYIEFIENYSEATEIKQLISESNFQDKYNILLAKWNDLAPQWNELLQKHQSLLAESESKSEWIENLKTEIVQIKNNTIQYDNISIAKVFKAIKNLPIVQLAATIGFVIALIVGSFKLGLMYQENSMNSEKYQLNKEIDNNKDLIKQQEKQIDALQTENSKLKQKRDSTGNK